MADKQSSGAPRGSRALHFIGGVALNFSTFVAVLILLIVGWVTWGHYRPDLMVDPINRHVHLAYVECRDAGRCPSDAGGWRSMVPDVFAIGEPREEVRTRLLAAGFEEWVLEGNEEHYRRLGAALRPLFCTKYYNLEVTFDTSGGLSAACSSFMGTPNCL